MKILVIILAIINLFCLELSSQTIFKDDFENDYKHWWLGNESDFSSELKNGKLVLSFNVDKQFKVIWKSIPIYYEKDFTISAEFKQLSGIDNHGFGFIWGTKDISNLYYFIISSNGQACIYKNNNNKWESIKDWKKFSAINPMGEVNRVELVQRNKKLQFRINDQVFLDTTGFSPFGSYVGFAINNIMKIEIDNLEVSYLTSVISVIDNPVQNISKQNLGPNINSKYSEVTPIISSDGNEIYFTRKEDPDNLGDKNYDDILYATRNKDGSWNKAVRLGSPINNDNSNAVIGLSSDGNSIILMNQYSDDGLSIKGGGISRSFKTSSGWSNPKDIEIENYYNNNPNRYENQFISADGNILILSAQRNDSYGSNDLYVSFWKDGKYSIPMNLGPVVNSLEMDYSPFLGADGKTLYFASSGHPGYGSDDVFMCKRMDDSWTNWSEPKNLGNTINTSKGDAYFVLPASGEYAYMTSTDNSEGSNDIISIKLNESSKPDPVVLVYGKVMDSKTKQAIGTSIKVNKLKDNSELAIANSNPTTGDYKIILPYGENYSFMAAKDAYYSISENLDLNDYSSYKEIEKNLFLTKIEAGSIFRLNNVFFDFDKFELKAESFPELNRLIQYLNENPNVQIEIAGHTDNQGGNEYNSNLSKNRAKAVLEYLTANGINSNRLKSFGYGATKPISSNDSEEGRQNNRRVEVKVLSK